MKFPCCRTLGVNPPLREGCMTTANPLTPPSPIGLAAVKDSIFCCCCWNLPLWELSSYHHISKKIVWKYYYATISIWSPTNSGVKISVSLKGFRICNNICTPFWGFGSSRPVCLKRSQHLEVFYSSQFWNLNFEISKVSFPQNSWSFWDMLWKDVPFLSLENKFIINF